MERKERIKTHYPDYDVLSQQDHWDDHTREIVLKRLDIPGQFQKLTGDEADLIRAMAALFVDDARSDLLDYIVKHFDNKLRSDKGESERKPNVPPQKHLFKKGWRALDHLASTRYEQPFPRLSAEQQIALLVGMENDTETLETPDGETVPAKPFFNAMLTETVSAYYSHPLVWSEIGYGGPAYPRGYVRSEYGLTDPWEAKRDA
ncbi:MAG TPA: gluconate 2-dehydrogenase subunit 3 family protein [Bacilli bacterium]|nr:gluconate 2-dehydrogenase subunit 3 family protein [Bacilli bacterium]